VRLPKVDGTAADAALRCHLDALVNEWKAADGATDRDRQSNGVSVPPFPTLADAFIRLLEHGWDADATARPHGHRTTVVMHVDLESKVADLHLGPALTEAERRGCGSVRGTRGHAARGSASLCWDSWTRRCSIRRWNLQ